MSLEADLAPFRHCPSCTAGALAFSGDKRVRCRACGLTFYFNAATAVGLVLQVGDEVLLAERARDPAAGRLDFPGGFVDPGEPLEDAVVRETEEELGLTVDRGALRYLLSLPNRYPFGDITYRVCDVFFTARLPTRPELSPADDVSAGHWYQPERVPPERVAFPSVARVLRHLGGRADSSN